MASFFPCAVGKHKTDTKLATMYVAWRVPGGERAAFKLRLCPPHYLQEQITMLQQHLPEDGSEPLACYQCGQTADPRDTDLMFVTTYVPGREAYQTTIPLCVVCAVNQRGRIRALGELLPDRGVGGGAPPLSDPWSEVP